MSFGLKNQFLGHFCTIFGCFRVVYGVLQGYEMIRKKKTIRKGAPGTFLLLNLHKNSFGGEGKENKKEPKFF